MSRLSTEDEATLSCKSDDIVQANQFGSHECLSRGHVIQTCEDVRCGFRRGFKPFRSLPRCRAVFHSSRVKRFAAMPDVPRVGIAKFGLYYWAHSRGSAGSSASVSRMAPIRQGARVAVACYDCLASPGMDVWHKNPAPPARSAVGKARLRAVTQAIFAAISMTHSFDGGTRLLSPPPQSPPPSRPVSRVRSLPSGRGPLAARQ